MAIDPVCGMEVDERTTKDKATHEGTTYYFCSTDCKDEFQSRMSFSGLLKTTLAERKETPEPRGFSEPIGDCTAVAALREAQAR